MSESTQTIVLVEDDIHHAMLIEIFIKDSGCNFPIKHFLTGEDILEYLLPKGGGKDKAAALQAIDHTSLVILDLKLSGIPGTEVLEALKGDSRTKHIPVMVLSTSSHPKDLEFCYSHGVNAYLVKPGQFEAFQDTIQKAVHFWTQINVLPTNR